MKKQFQSKSVPRGTRTIWRYLGALFILLTFGIGQMWGADAVAKISFKNAGMATTYSATKISANPSTVGDVNVSWTNIGGFDKQYVSSTTTKDSCVKIDQSAGDSYTTKYLQFSSSKVITKIELYAAIPGSTSAANEAIVGWSGEPSDTPDTVAVVSIPGKGTSNLTTINFPSAKGIKYVRCYRQIKIKDGKFDSKGTATGSSTTWCVAYAQITTTDGGGGGGYSITYDCDGANIGCPSTASGKTALPNPLPTPMKYGYSFDGWFTSSAKTAAVTAGGALSKDTTLYAKWTKVYVPQGANYVFENNATVGTNPSKTVGSETTYDPFRVDNMFFSQMKIAYESGTEGFGGWKIKTKNATIKFYVENDSRVTVTTGTLSGDCKITYTAKGASSETTVSLSAATANGYNVKAGSMVTITPQSTSTVTLKGIAVSEIPAASDDATLSDLKVGGTTVDGFAANKLDYYVELPYGSTSQPTVTATKHDTKASAVITQTIASLDNATVTVTAEDGTTTNTYTVHFTVAPKFGVELIKVATTGGTNKTVTGLYAGEGDVNLSDNKKMDKYKYIGFTLVGTTLQAGDQINVHTSSAATQGGSHVIFYNNMTDKTELYETGEIGGKGNNLFAPNANMIGASTAYVYRSDADNPHKWNGYVDYLAVYRLMPAFIDSFSIEGVEDFVIDQDLKTITASVANTFDVTSLTPTIKYWGNGGGAIDKTGAQNFTNPVTYTVSSSYAEDATGAYAPVTYTVTITKIVPAETPNITTDPASAYYIEGETIAALNVVASVTDGGTLGYQWQEQEGANWNNITNATNDSYTPNVSAIGTYKYRVIVTNTLTGHPAAQDTSAVATIVIDEDPAAIKLLNGSTVNTAKFITGVAASKVTIGTTEYDCVTFEGTVGSSVASSNMKLLDRHVTYNATTDKTKIKLSLYNANTSNKRTIYVQGVIEGNTNTEDIVNLATIELAKGEQKTTEYIEFNNAKNRSIYIFVSSNAGDIKILQEKIIESGTALKKAGESGYSLNMNKGRIFGAKEATLAFEGLSYTLAGDYTPVASEVLKVKSSNIVFTVNNPTLMKVTTANDKTYYVTKDAAGDDNETAKTGVSEFDLTAGTWYITAGGSEVQFTNIAFEAPKCEKPTVADMDDVDLCEGAAFTALAVSASVSDEGTLHYAWFKEAGETDEAVGTDAATYTPAADGQYYVIVTNHKDNFTDNSKTSNTITVEHFAAAVITTAPVDVMKEAGQSATLSVVASGKNCTYEWFACDDALGTNPVAFIPAETGTSLTVTVAGEKYYKVEVSSDCGAPVSAVAKVKEWTAYPQADVTGSITWDWTNAAWPAEGTASFKVVDGELDLLANQNSIVPVVDGVNGFRADMLLGSGQYVWRYGGADKKCFQGTELKFHTTVAGTVTLWYRSTSSGKDVKVYINGNDAGHHSTGNYTKSSTIVVPANSDVRITKEGETYVRINKIVFNANPDYTRNVSNNIGTLCVDHNVLAGGALGATFYQIASRNEIYNDKIDFEEVGDSEELVAGQPYIFQSTTGRIDLFYGATDADEPVAVRGMHGWFDATAPIDPTKYDMLDITEENKEDILYISSNKLWNCGDLVESDLKVVNNRAYIVMSEVPTYAEYQEAQTSNPAPRRRVTLGKDATQTTTGVENFNASEQPVKLLINGQLFIIRGEKMFNANGQLVK